MRFGSAAGRAHRFGVCLVFRAYCYEGRPVAESRPAWDTTLFPPHTQNHMTATNITRTVGIENSTIKVGNGLTLNADAGTLVSPSNTLATDLVVSGDAIALARTDAQAGILHSTIQVGEEAAIKVTEASVVGASATTTSGNARATANNQGPTGGIQDYGYTPGDITIGKDGTIGVVVSNLASAAATSTGGSATSAADVGQKTGLYNIDIAAGLGKSLSSTVNAAIISEAKTVGLPVVAPGNASAYAGAPETRVVGIYNTGSAPLGAPVKISFGDSASINAAAGSAATPIGLVSKSETVSGDASSYSQARIIAGISSDRLNQLVGTAPDTSPLPSNHIDISIGRDGTLNAAGYANTGSTAKAVNGRASALIDLGTVAGIADERILRGESNTGSTVAIGNNGTVNAAAAATNVASATSTTSPSAVDDVKATINNDYVVGIAIDKLAVGNAATITSSAASSQTASAATVSSGADPYASVAADDHVYGISNTDILAGTTLTGLGASAILQGSATATSVSASPGTVAYAGSGSSVAGINHGSLSVGEYVINGANLGTVTASGAVGLGALASAVTGPAVASAGGWGAEVIGLNSSPISIGLGGNVNATGNGDLISNASTTTGDAYASSVELGRGILTSPISIGQIGTVQAGSVLTGSSTSQTVTGNATSLLGLNAAGIEQGIEKIAIGDTGNAIGSARVSGNTQNGGAVAAGVTGTVGATAEIASRGIALGTSPAGANIAIGNKGNVQGTGVIGTLNPTTGALDQSLKVTATNTTGQTTAHGYFDAAGIAGTLGTSVPATSIKAGPTGGDITGQAASAGDVLSSTITGPASAGTHAHVSGISNADLTAGLVGTNQILGSAVGRFTTTSSSVNNDSTASSDASIFGINGWGNSLTLSGNLDAIAQLSNTVTATSVNGNATATANSSVVGLSGYDVHILGSGVINASAISNSIVSASTVTA